MHIIHMKVWYTVIQEDFKAKSIIREKMNTDSWFNLLGKYNLSLYVHSITASKYVKETLTELRGKRDTFTLILGDLPNCLN